MRSSAIVTVVRELVGAAGNSDVKRCKAWTPEPDYLDEQVSLITGKHLRYRLLVDC